MANAATPSPDGYPDGKKPPFMVSPPQDKSCFQNDCLGLGRSRWKEALCFCDIMLLKSWEDFADFPVLCLGEYMFYKNNP